MVPDLEVERERGMFVARYGKPASEQTGISLVNSRNLAILHRSGYIGSEHLLGALAELQSAGPLFDQLEIDPKKIVRTVDFTIYKGNPTQIASDVDYTPRSDKILGLAAAQSNIMVDPEVEPYHLALAMAEEREGVAGAILEALGADYSRIQRAVTMLKGQS